MNLKSKRQKASDEKQATKTSDRKHAAKTIENMKKIKEYLSEKESAKTSDIAHHIGLSSARTRMILSEMDDIEVMGGNNNRRYRLKNSRNVNNGE